jgi:energy-coupling factor transport system substrate-specific component
MSWELASFALLGLVLAGGFAWYEGSRPPARVVSLVATLAALAVVGRIAFAPFPNVKPTTDIVLFAGYALGPVPGFAVGAVTALASNVFFGQGPWTPWQMTGWGLVGVGGGGLAWLMRGREPPRLVLALVCALAGLAYGALLDLYQWTLAAQQDVASYLAVSASSLPYNLAHAMGNFGFALLIGPAFLRALRRYRRRFEVRWVRPAPAALLAAALLAGSLAAAGPGVRAASSPAGRAAHYLESVQNVDGGFGASPRQSSSPSYTAWAGLGLAAAGVNPRDVRHPKRTPIGFTRTHARQLSDTSEIARTILLLRAAGLSPRSFAHRDLAGQLASRQRTDGSFGELVNQTAFAVMALRASSVAGAGVRRAARWLEGQRNSDGGFGFGPRGGASDVDDTGAVLQALASAGRGGSSAARSAIRYLRLAQNPDGGFGQMKDRGSNAQSTAWAAQGLLAAGRNPERLRRGSRTPLGYIASLQTRSGSIRYSRTSAQTPVWVTAQALTALARKPFPIAPVKLRAPVKVASGGSTATAPPRSHGQTITPAPRAAPTSSGGTVPRRRQTEPPERTSPPDVSFLRAREPLSPVARRKNGGNGAVMGVLAGVGFAALLAGGYLARRRLHARRPPAPST